MMRYAFEPFGTLQDVLAGSPIKIMPLGTFYRDERQLTITPDVLKQMESNFKDGLPRFRVPINENHAGIGKVGTVEDVAFLPDGADGPGLYATKYELTEAGQTLVKEGRFDAVSPEVVWTLNEGARYQDPQTGELHDNVLIGLALTDRPFFGHDHVALFSATPQESQAMAEMPTDKIDQILAMLREMMKPHPEMPEMESAPAEGDEFAVWSTAMVNDLPDSCFLYIEPGGEKDSGGKTTPRSLRHFPYKDASGKVDLPHLRNALARIPQSSLPPDVKARVASKARGLAADNGIGENASDHSQKEVSMADEVKKEAAPAEGFSVAPGVNVTPGVTVTPEEFKALQEKAAQVEELKARLDQSQTKAQADQFVALQEKTAQLEAVKSQAEDFKAKLAQVTHERDFDRMKAHADQFLALPIKADELAKRLLELKTASPELFDYFDGLLKHADEMITKADLFKQVAQQSAQTVETFEAVIDQVLAEKFNGDRSKYSEAMTLARTRRPDLADAYVSNRR